MKKYDVDHLDVSYKGLFVHNDYITRVGPPTIDSNLDNRLIAETADISRALEDRTGVIFSIRVWPTPKPTKNNTFDKSWSMV